MAPVEAALIATANALLRPSLQDLTNIDGIGERRARAIVVHREEASGFSSLDALLKLPYFDDVNAPDYDALKEKLEIRSETIETRGRAVKIDAVTAVLANGTLGFAADFEPHHPEALGVVFEAQGETSDMEYRLILGAGSGIGAALARRIARPETRMLLHTGRNREGLEAVAQDCRAAGADIDLCLGDMGAPEPFVEIGGWLDDVPASGLVSLVFAAGYARLGPVTETPVDALTQALQAMPVAFHRLVAIAAPKLAPERGRVVCVSAFGAHRAKTHNYSATAPAKSALEAQVRAFAASFAPQGITVNAVVPGFIQKEPGTPSSLTPEQWAQVTTGIPMRRIGRREEVASTIEYLLSEDAGYITGQAIHVNGGLTL